MLQKIPNPVWVHPVSGERVEEQGANNPLGSHWIAFHRDCRGRGAHDGDAWITIKGCTTTGFHGTPPTAGQWDGPSPMAVCGFTTRMCVLCIARCRLELR